MKNQKENENTIENKMKIKIEYYMKEISSNSDAPDEILSYSLKTSSNPTITLAYSILVPSIFSYSAPVCLVLAMYNFIINDPEKCSSICQCWNKKTESINGYLRRFEQIIWSMRVQPHSFFIGLIYKIPDIRKHWRFIANASWYQTKDASKASTSLL